MHNHRIIILKKIRFLLLIPLVVLTSSTIVAENSKREFLGAVLLPAYAVPDAYPYTSRKLVNLANPVELYKQPILASEAESVLEVHFDIDTRFLGIDVFGASVFNVEDGWYQVLHSETNEYFWIKPEDSGELVSYIDLLDNWQFLAGNNEGYLLHQKPDLASSTTNAVGFGSGSPDQGSLYVEVLEQKRVDGILWFKVAEITSTLCDKGYPWDLGTTGWIRAHHSNGNPIFGEFGIC